MSKLDNIIEDFNKINWNDDISIMNFILSYDSDIYDGKNVDGESIIISIDKGNGMSVRTYINDKTVKINTFSIVENKETGACDLQKEELFEPCYSY